jgi:hypothetical protein
MDIWSVLVYTTAIKKLQVKTTLGESVEPVNRGVERKENTIEREMQALKLISFAFN